MTNAGHLQTLRASAARVLDVTQELLAKFCAATLGSAAIVRVRIG